MTRLLVKLVLTYLSLLILLVVTFSEARGEVARWSINDFNVGGDYQTRPVFPKNFYFSERYFQGSFTAALVELNSLYADRQKAVAGYTAWAKGVESRLRAEHRAMLMNRPSGTRADLDSESAWSVRLSTNLALQSQARRALVSKISGWDERNWVVGAYERRGDRNYLKWVRIVRSVGLQPSIAIHR